MYRYPSAERFILLRNFSYGGAASCLIILLQLTQLGAKDLSLQVATVAAAVGLPLWITLGFTYENYITLGKQSYPHIRTTLARVYIAVFVLSSGFALAAAVGGILWYILPNAALAFVATTFGCLLISYFYQWVLARWWFAGEGPSSRKSEDEADRSSPGGPT